MMVLVQLDSSGSGGRRTLVKIPGTSSEKCRETNVETRLDFPTPSVNHIDAKRDDEYIGEMEVKLYQEHYLTNPMDYQLKNKKNMSMCYES